MKNSAVLTPPADEGIRILERGLRTKRGVHLSLRAVREAVGHSQSEISKATQLSPADVSKLEEATTLDDCQFASLRDYVEALEGELEIVARFDTKKIHLCGSQERTD